MVLRNGPAVAGALLLCSSRPCCDDRDLDLLSDLREHILAALLKARLVQDLQSTSDKKSEVVRIAAHDLRSPLATIVAFLQLMAGKMRSERFDAEAAAQRIEGLVGVGRQGLQLMERLLDLSAIESGRDELRRKRAELGQLLGERVTAHRERARSKEIELHLSTDRSLPEVQADTTRIAQVVDNLIGNAIKYTHPGGAVHVGCEARAHELVISVRDTGQGLTREDLQQVFRSFKRLSARPTGGEPSTGLGLAIAKSIVERHGGRLWVESEHGQGATFSFSLPIQPEG
jgi:signal transduction histidine kinase